MSDWTPGIIAANCLDGAKSLPGWISDPFGLDWGVNRETLKPAWVLHHLPTGWVMMAIDHEIIDVIQCVDLIRSLGDWSFTDPAGVEDFKDCLQVVRASGFTVFNARLVGRPTFPDQIKAVA
jgi:hypothetical protein